MSKRLLIYCEGQTEEMIVERFGFWRKPTGKPYEANAHALTLG